MNEKNILTAECVSKSYFQAGKKIKVIENASFNLLERSVNIISGKSGSGKSTLLHLIGGLDKPDSGFINFFSENIVSYQENKLNDFRNNNIGFVFQFHHLLADFTAGENVIIPLRIKGNIPDEKIKFADAIIERLGIAERKNHYPNQMSGGEQQRAAIARALVNNPKLLLADEPTGNLDNETASEVMNLFWEINKEFGTTIVIVTHDKNINENSANFFELKSGQIIPLNK